MFLIKNCRFINANINYNVNKLFRIHSRFQTISYVIPRTMSGGIASEHTELTDSIKLDIEKRWHDQMCTGNFSKKNNAKDKFYVLSMFPYPAGNLHMGHVRVYTISDTIARFYRMNGKNVFHPIGWDAFGLPAENAAFQRKIDPDTWTCENILQMRGQLNALGCSFDWSHELSTCQPDYYKWTQKLFLMLFKEGLAYQKEAQVNWDPVDKTVLADEQVDANGRSWRSGAKVEKKNLKQWFLRTTKFAKQLLDGLSDPTLKDWKDIINLQRHWIGECDGYAFDLKVLTSENQNPESTSKQIRIWTESPEKLLDSAGFVIVKPTNFLAKETSLKETRIYNPFSKKSMILKVSDEIEYPAHCDSYLASPSTDEKDNEFSSQLGVQMAPTENSIKEKTAENIIETAKDLKIGGYPVSSKLQDWLISRQRRWGTPIPIIHCKTCGAVPIAEESLPVLLPPVQTDDDSISTICPKCNSQNAKRETDTMDTFVDSSWYFLRYLDSKNQTDIFDAKTIKNFMPVDLYIGGKEHAVLHLYYARFMNHFLHSLGLVPQPEPFQRLLVQGMVMGRSYRVKETGSYIRENEATIVDEKKNKAIEKSTGNQVIMTWEKMSKSKLNGVDPSEMISEYGCDTTRLIILGDVAPTSHRNWSKATFPGILYWQNRLWITLNDFECARNEISSDLTVCADDECKMFDARNYYVSGVTFNYRYSHQLSVAISKMQGLTNSIRKATKNVIAKSKQYERALASQIIMLAPMAPHFASELWTRFTSTRGRLNENSEEIQWERSVLEQFWPQVDMNYELELNFLINGFEKSSHKMPRTEFENLTHDQAMQLALQTKSVKDFILNKGIRKTSFILYPGYQARLNIFLERPIKEKSAKSSEENLLTEN